MPSITQTSAFRCCPSPITIKDNLFWCERQLTRITSPLPVANRLKEIALRIALILSVVIPLLGALSKLIYQPNVIDRLHAVERPFPVMKPPAPIPAEKQILDGYGDFILRFRGDSDPVDLATFAQASAALEKFQIVRWMGEHPQATAQDRLQALKEEIGRIDSRLELTFIPKTLFELFFLRKTMEEDLEKAEKFPYRDPQHPTEEELEEVRGICYSSKNSWLNCMKNRWQLLKFEESEDTPEPTARLNKIAHRFNGAFQALLSEKQFGAVLSMGQIETLLEEQIAFIQENAVRATPFANCNEPSPISHFSSESGRGNLKSMKLADQSMTDILRHAVRLECAEEAQGKAILYRGGKLKEDFPVINKRDIGETCYSLSSGGSLFAGIVEDPGATAFHYMRTRDRDAYALLIDPQNANDGQLFFVPPSSSLKPLFEGGEWFHGRSKAYVMNPKESVYGYFGVCAISYEEFPHKSALQKDRFIALFQEKMNQGFLFKAGVAKKLQH